MIGSVTNSENIYNNVREEGASLPPSSKVNETAEVKAEIVAKKSQQVREQNAPEIEPDDLELEVDPEELNEALERLNEKLYLSNREILFKTEKKINKNYISVIDKNSQEIIKEFPPKEIRRFLIGLKELEEKLGTNKDVKHLIINLEV